MNIKPVFVSSIVATFLFSANALWAAPTEDALEKVAKCNEKQCNQLRLDNIKGLTAIPNEALSVRRLGSLDLSRLELTDIAPLSGLKALGKLNLSRSKITDILALAGATGLKSLNLSGSMITVLSPLANFKGLKKLDISDTQVSDFAPLKKLRMLRALMA